MRLDSRRAVSVARLERLAVLGSETLLGGTSGPTLLVAGRPDRDAARRDTADLRSLGWLRLAVEGDEASAELFATARHPVRRRLPLPAALALAEAGVPTLLVRTGNR